MLDFKQAVKYIMTNCDERMQAYDCIDDLYDNDLEIFSLEYLDALLGRVEVKLYKPFNQLQMQERNSVLIAQHECELYIHSKLGSNVFTTSFDNNSDLVTLSCFLVEL